MAEGSSKKQRSRSPTASNRNRSINPTPLLHAAFTCYNRLLQQSINTNMMNNNPNHVVGRPSSSSSTTANSHNQSATDPQLYFRIVCEPGHERTARELRQLPKERRERVWSDMTGDPTTTHYAQQQQYYDNKNENQQLLDAKLSELSTKLYNLIIRKQKEEQGDEYEQQEQQENTIGSKNQKPPSSSSSSCHALCQAYYQDPDLFLHRHYSSSSNNNTKRGTSTTAASSHPSNTTTSAADATTSSGNRNMKQRSIDFHLMFLRCCRFHIEPTISLMIKYFKTKLHLFGLSRLTKRITLEDLSDEDKQSLTSGGIQVLPQRDHAGRLVIFSRYRNWFYPTHNEMHLLRAVWYLFHVCVQDDVMTQQLGAIIVGYELVDGDSSSSSSLDVVDDDYVPIDHETTRQMFRVLQTIPVRVVAAHTCFNDTPTQKVVDLVIHMVSNFVRLRLRCHRGSHQEVKYRLMTMGIPVNCIPISDSSNNRGSSSSGVGRLKLDAHQAWLHYRLRQEATLIDDIEDINEVVVVGSGSASAMMVDDDSDNDDDE